ncbi:MAG: V-type ATP synthase subunit E [Nitrososphaeria archaeon]
MSSSGVKVVDDVVELEMKKLDEMLESSESEALERVRKHEEETLKELDDLRRVYSMRAEGIRSRLLGMAEIKARGELLKLLDEKSGDIVKEAMRAISSMERDAKYEKILEALLHEASQAIGSADLVVKPAKPDAAVVKKLLARISKGKRFKGISFRLSEDAVDSIGGLVVESADGRVSYDNTFEARLARYQETIKGAIFEEIKGG